MHVYLFCPGDLVTRSGDREIRSIYIWETLSDLILNTHNSNSNNNNNKNNDDDDDDNDDDDDDDNTNNINNYILY